MSVSIRVYAHMADYVCDLTQEGDPGDFVPRCPWCFPPGQGEGVDSNVHNLHPLHCLDWF